MIRYYSALTACTQYCLVAGIVYFIGQKLKMNEKKLLKSTNWWTWESQELVVEFVKGSRSSSRMHVMNHNWSATKQRLHPQSVAEISRHSVFFRGQDSTMWNIVWVSPQGHRSVSVSRHFLLQAPQCPCSLLKRFSRDHCCRERSKGSNVLWQLSLILLSLLVSRANFCHTQLC